MAATKESKPVKLSAEMLAEMLALDKERLELGRRVAALEKQIEPIKTACKNELSASGKGSTVRFGYRLTLVDGNVSVGWKNEFIRVAGADAAEAIQNSTPPSKKLLVVLEKPKAE